MREEETSPMRIQNRTREGREVYAEGLPSNRSLSVRGNEQSRGDQARHAAAIDKNLQLARIRPSSHVMPRFLALRYL